MHRNLDRRVEVLASITNPTHVAEISGLFDIAFDAGTASWWLDADGKWTARTTDDQGEPLLDMQDYLIGTKSRRRATPK
jgi:polyphosphate kinase